MSSYLSTFMHSFLHLRMLVAISGQGWDHNLNFMIAWGCIIEDGK